MPPQQREQKKARPASTRAIIRSAVGAAGLHLGGLYNRSTLWVNRSSTLPRWRAYAWCGLFSGGGGEQAGEREPVQLAQLGHEVSVVQQPVPRGVVEEMRLENCVDLDEVSVERVGGDVAADEREGHTGRGGVAVFHGQREHRVAALRAGKYRQGREATYCRHQIHATTGVHRRTVCDKIAAMRPLIGCYRSGTVESECAMEGCSPRAGRPNNPAQPGKCGLDMMRGSD